MTFSYPKLLHLRGRTQIDQFGRDPDGQGDRRTAVQNGGSVRILVDLPYHSA
jgi:hypothetical protein